VPGVTVNRFCSSGLQTIAMAAQRVIVDGATVIVAGGVESISCVQNEANTHMIVDPWLKENKPESTGRCCRPPRPSPSATASRARRRTEYGARSQQRAAARAAGKFNDEIVPITTTMVVTDKATGQTLTQGGHALRRRGHPRRHHLRGRRPRSSPAIPGGVIAAGNASQFSDGASACVVMDAKLAEKRNLKPLGIFRGFAVAGCEPDEMGIGPVFAVPKLLERTGLKVDDIGLWELNEAFAVQVLYCRDKLGIPDDRSTSTAARSRSAIPTA
jgi:acetyl-CoA C-acetyltransferase